MPSSDAKTNVALAITLWLLFMGAASTFLLEEPLTSTGLGVVHVDTRTLRQFMGSRNVGLLMFHKAECPACQMLKPAYQLAGDALHEKYGVPVFATADVDVDLEMADAFQIKYLPKLFIWRGTWQPLSQEVSALSSSWEIMAAFEEQYQYWREDSGSPTGLVANGARLPPNGLVSLLSTVLWHFRHPSLLLYLVVMIAVMNTIFVLPLSRRMLEQMRAAPWGKRFEELLGWKSQRSSTCSRTAVV